MSADLLQFAGSFAAVSVLVLVVHLAGFSRSARLLDEGEARELASLAPGGFAADRVALDHDGRGAILANAAGDLLLLRQHGGQFVPERLARHTITADGDMLKICSGGQAIALRIGHDAALWAGTGLAR